MQVVKRKFDACKQRAPFCYAGGEIRKAVCLYTTRGREISTPARNPKVYRHSSCLPIYFASMLHCGEPGQLSRYSYSLGAGRSGDRIQVEARFSAHVQTDPGAHPASYTMGTGTFPGVKRPGCGVDHPPPSSAEIKERAELYIYSPSRPLWPVLR